jgi:hypothetical protein
VLRDTLEHLVARVGPAADQVQQSLDHRGAEGIFDFVPTAMFQKEFPGPP